jgi:aryl-phospho-beta-D-glucosidase BglC (GH1 family)
MIKLDGYIKGVNLGGWLSQGSLEISHLDSFIKEEDIKKIKEIGCDHLRLPVDFENIYDEKNMCDNMIGYKYIDLCISWCKKYNLNVVLDLHKAPGYVFDDFEYSNGFFTNEKLMNLFLDIWDRLSKRYSKYSDMMMFEMLNEVTSFDVINEWNDLALRCIKTIRKNAKDVKILFGGVGYSSVKAVKYLPKPYDENIVYNVHCYEPMAFSHQGAYWVDKMPLDFRMPYPVDKDKYESICKIVPSIENGTLGNSQNALKLLKDNFFINLFKEAVDYANENNVALYCGEYGVIDRADTKSTLNWFKDINNAFEYYGIGRAVWSFKKMDFGIVDEHYSDIFKELIKYL